MGNLFELSSHVIQFYFKSTYFIPIQFSLSIIFVVLMSGFNCDWKTWQYNYIKLNEIDVHLIGDWLWAHISIAGIDQRGSSSRHGHLSSSSLCWHAAAACCIEHKTWHKQAVPYICRWCNEGFHVPFHVPNFFRSIPMNTA